MRGYCCGNLRERTYFILVSAMSLATSELLRNLIEAWHEDSSWSLSADPIPLVKLGARKESLETVLPKCWVSAVPNGIAQARFCHDSDF